MISINWVGGVFASISAICVYRSVSYIQSEVQGFIDPETGKPFRHVRIDRGRLVAGLIFGVLAAIFSVSITVQP